MWDFKKKKKRKREKGDWAYRGVMWWEPTKILEYTAVDVGRAHRESLSTGSRMLCYDPAFSSLHLWIASYLKKWCDVIISFFLIWNTSVLYCCPNWALKLPCCNSVKTFGTKCTLSPRMKVVSLFHFRPSPSESLCMPLSLRYYLYTR